MTTHSGNLGECAKRTPSGHLLILACSQRKRDDTARAPALHVYDGVNFRVLRRVLRERGWAPGLQIKILSAKYGLIDATSLIAPYDQRLDRRAAGAMTGRTLAELRKIPPPATVFLNLGRDYVPAVNGLERVFPDSQITFADGAIGLKMKAMKEWLQGLPCRTATVRGSANRKRCCLYFFPDWDDYVYEPFSSDDEKALQGTRTYAHELCGARTPFDGILLSLSQIDVGKGALYRLTDDRKARVPLRTELRIPPDLLLFGDSGAFSYAAQSTPPFTPKQAAELYDRFGFDIGASVDHIPLPQISFRHEDGTTGKHPLSRSARYGRMYLTRDNADEFLQISRRRAYGFIPLGVIQGIGPRSYVDRLHEYLDMGYTHVALGGLVPRTDRDILEIVCEVRRALQARTRERRENVWLHLFGILRPKLQPIFAELGVSSFDSASYYRKSWLRSDQNYLAPDGRSWYGTIRVPISTSKRMRQAALGRGLTEAQLAELERECLATIEACNDHPDATNQLVKSIDQYGPLLQRKSENNHFDEEHALLLKDRPWEKCSCPFCRSAGIHAVVFRGASRNKRRGFHNTWVFYHKVLHGNALPTSFSENR